MPFARTFLVLSISACLVACGDDGGSSQAGGESGTGGGGGSGNGTGTGTGGTADGAGGTSATSNSSGGEPEPCSFAITEDLQCDDGCDVPLQTGGSRAFCTLQCDSEDPTSCPEGMVCDTLFCMFPCEEVSDCPPGFSTCFVFARDGTCRP